MIMKIDDLITALSKALRLCPTCSGSGEVDARPYLSAGEAEELSRAGVAIEPKTTRLCLTCDEPRRVLMEYKKMKYQYKAIVQKVVDGDTITALVDCGFRIKHQISLRLFGINAPERNTLGGSNSTAYLKEKLPIGREIVIETFKNPTDKYGRWLATIYLDGADLNKMMVADGHAVNYTI